MKTDKEIFYSSPETVKTPRKPNNAAAIWSLFYLKFALEAESPAEYALKHVNFNLPTTVGNP